MNRHLSPAFEGHVHAEIAGRVAKLWAELFDDASLVAGPDDNFFALGGSSLLAVEMVDQLRHELSIPLSLVAVVEKQTLAELAAHIASLLDSAHGQDLEEGLL